MTTLYEGAFAKVNLTLDVLGKRADGYHDLQSVMQTVSIRDDVEIDVGTGKPWRLLCSVEGIPTDEKNLAWKAAKVYCDAMGKDPEGLEIRIVKRIPAGAGLGGGSADAAAALLGLNLMWNLGLTEPELYQAAQACGADVPFLLRGGLARVRGIGERIEPLPCAKSYPVVIVQPCKGLSTPQVFGAFDALDSPPRNPDPQAVAAALEAGDVHALAASMGNVLEAAAVPQRPEIAVCAQMLEHYGALCAQMTGSGSAVVALFADRHVAEHASMLCSRIWPRTYLAFTARSGVWVERQGEPFL